MKVSMSESKEDTMEQQTVKFRDMATAERDALASAGRFSPVLPEGRVVLNSLPKSGTVLLRNVLLHFFGAAVSERATLEPKRIEKFETFDDLFPSEKMFLTAHFPLYPQSSAFFRSMKDARMLLLIRNPLENSYSLARHLMRPGQQRLNRLSNYIGETGASVEEVVYYCIRGYSMGGGAVEGVVTRYMHYVAWVGLGAKLVRYEDLIRAGRDLKSEHSEAFFREIADFLQFRLPENWRDRVHEAFAPERSWTYAYIEPGVEKYPNKNFFAGLLAAEAGPLLQFLGYSRDASQCH
jgi:hypothetical protein